MKYQVTKELEVGNAWEPDVENPESVSIEAYKIIFTESKERFSELILASQEVTKQAYKFLFSLLAGVAAFSSFFIDKLSSIADKTAPSIMFILFVIAASFCFHTLIELIKSKDVINKGSDPDELFHRSAFPASWNNEKALYYSEIIRYQKKVDFTRTLNKERSVKYDSLINKLVFLFVILVITFYSVI